MPKPKSVKNSGGFVCTPWSPAHVAGLCCKTHPLLRQLVVQLVSFFMLKSRSAGLGPQTVFSSIDSTGRYAFGNQPLIAKWNMGQLAQSLMLLVKPDDSETLKSVRSLYSDFTEKYERACTKMLANKFGLDSNQPDTVKFMHEFLEHMNLSQLDYTLTFDKLTRSLSSEKPAEELKTELKGLYATWREKITNQKIPAEALYKPMRQANPVVIPRNHHIEAVIKNCQDTGNPDSALEMHKVLQSPYKELPGTSDYQDAPSDKDYSHQTFCGT